MECSSSGWRHPGNRGAQETLPVRSTSRSLLILDNILYKLIPQKADGVFPYINHPIIFWGCIGYAYRRSGLAHRYPLLFQSSMPTPFVEAVITTVSSFLFALNCSGIQPVTALGVLHLQLP